MSRELVLAIETSISSGSLSILEGPSEIDFWIGSNDSPRSEDLLSNIAKLLSKNGINKSEITKIAVSMGPGSFTGVRVGIATAKGLAYSLNCKCIFVQLLEAMTLGVQSTENTIAAFAVAEGEICWQVFETDSKNQTRSRSNPKIGLIKDFMSDLNTHSVKSLAITESLNKRFSESEPSLNFGDYASVNIVYNPARQIGLKSSEITLTEVASPIYIRNAGII